MTQRKQLFLVIIAAVMVVAVVGFLVAAAGAQEQGGEGERESAAATDSVEFSAEFQAEEKLPEVVGQYAWTSINGQVVESVYSTEPQAVETRSFGLAGNACAYGGAQEGCLGSGDVANAKTENGRMEDLAERRRLLVLGLVYAGAQVTAPFTTGARCFINADGSPGIEPQQPAGEVSYGGSALLGSLPDESINLRTINHGVPFADDIGVGVLLNLLFALDVEVEIESNWDQDSQGLRAYSEVKANYRILNGSSVLSEDSFTARSECGMLMSDGTGSTGPAGVSAQSLAAPQALRLADPEAPETTDSPAQPQTAPGSPQATGFSEESSLAADDGSPYHLLSTRELGLLDREQILDVLAATRETGAVEGETAAARWWFYSAEAAGEQVPVLEIELADATIVQVRPDLPGAQHPAPDMVHSETQPTTTPSTTTSQLPEPTTEPTAQPTTQPTPESIPTTSAESGEDAEND